MLNGELEMEKNNFTYDEVVGDDLDSLKGWGVKFPCRRYFKG